MIKFSNNDRLAINLKKPLNILFVAMFILGMYLLRDEQIRNTNKQLIPFFLLTVSTVGLQLVAVHEIRKEYGHVLKSLSSSPRKLRVAYVYTNLTCIINLVCLLMEVAFRDELLTMINIMFFGFIHFILSGVICMNVVDYYMNRGYASLKPVFDRYKVISFASAAVLFFGSIILVIMNG